MAEENKTNLNKTETILFTDLVDLKAWQAIQDNFSVVTNIQIRTLDAKGAPITAPSSEPRLCNELLRYAPFKEKICNLCLPSFLGGRGVVDKNLSFTCIAGLRNFIVPLQINNLAIGYILLGPLNLVRLKPKEEYLRQAEELHLDFEEFWSAVAEIKIVSFHVAHSLVNLIKNVGEYIINLSYQDFIRKKETLMPDSPKLHNLFDTLLEAAFQISKANIGSIMLLDKSKSELSLHTARGLPNEVIKNTRVKLGEGLSGIAAQEGKSLFIDDNIKNNRIKQYLNRPQISAALIIPIKVKKHTWGVMNLCTLRTSPAQLDANSAKLIDKLINLTTSFLHE